MRFERERVRVDQFKPGDSIGWARDAPLGLVTESNQISLSRWHLAWHEIPGGTPRVWDGPISAKDTLVRFVIEEEVSDDCPCNR